MLLKRHTWVIVFLQAALILVSLITAWLLRFEFAFPNRRLLFGAALLLVSLRLLAMWRFNLFHGYWRYTGVSDAEDICRAVAVGSGAFFVSLRYVLGVKAFPLSIYVLEMVLTATTLAGVRVLSRTIMRVFEQKHIERRTRVLIVGAGSAAEQLIRDLSRGEYQPIGCVDDDPAKRQARIHGVQVMGTIDDLPRVAKGLNVREIFIAMPSVKGPRLRRVIECCQRTGIKFKTIPGLLDLVEGRVTLSQLREVDVEDLLGREPVRLDLGAVRRDIEGRVVMVTGAAGSIGSELCRQILDYGPAKLICVDQAETPLFYLERKLSKNRYSKETAYYVADIADAGSMKKVLQKHGVDIIFNAAAYKHVPLMEFNPFEALRNNVFGLLTLLRVAEEAGCERFLLISSDKAVNPTSFMGCTKRLGELILASRPSRMRCVSVRFGNVLGSQGSVVPVFQEQIRKDKRVTVTHPEITRFFMTIPEAVSLVLQAFTVGEHGDILVLDMGEPVRIVDLARTLIELSGHAEAEVPIVFTGLRPGEKLYEELFYDSERLLATSHESVKRTHSGRMTWSKLEQQLRELHTLMSAGTQPSLRAKVKDIIPEYEFEAEASAEPILQIEQPLNVHTLPILQAAAD